MVYQRVSKPFSGNSHIHKKKSASTVPTTPVQAKSVSASPQEQEMPSYTPLPADWVTNNSLMRSLSEAQVVQRQEESGKEELEPIQAKLTIGQPGDKYEQEADETAQQVVSQINAPVSQQSSQGESLQREEMPEEEELQMKPESGIIQREEMLEEEELQMKSDGGGIDATPDLEASIQQAKGGGQPLSDNIREPMEQAFGADFSGVNVHTDAHSDRMNQSIQAKAFTTGQDIFFRQEAYDPGSRGGQELIAHELTHVMQQNGGAVMRSPTLLNLSQHSTTKTPSASEIVQRSVSDFVGFAKGIKESRLTDSYYSTWNYLLSELDNYAQLSDDDYTARQKKLDQIDQYVVAWKEKYQELSFSEQNKESNQSKYFYLTRGLIANHLSREQNEVRSLMSGTLGTIGKSINEVNPKLTKIKHDSYVEKGKPIFSDKSLKKKLKDTQMNEKRAELDLSVGLIPCTILEDFKSVKHIEYFENKISGENQAPPEFSNKVTGWVSASDIIPSMDIITEDESLRYIEVTAPLFPQKPSKDDVVQGGLGDCYLLAALISIVNSDPDFFQKIMVDDGKNVTVKLFDVDRSNDIHTFTPKYIKVPKTKVVSKVSNDDAYAQNSVWVQMLEKAFVGAGFTGVFENPKNEPESVLGGYAGIASGHMNVAFEYLLGKTSKVLDTKSRGERPNRNLVGSGISRFPWDQDEKLAYNELQGLTLEKNPYSSYKDLVSYEMLNRSTQNVDVWMKWLGENNLIEEVQKHAQKGMKEYAAEIRLEDFIAYFKTQSLEVGIASLVIDWLESYKVFPGKRGTGKYTVEQEELFRDIVEAINNGQYLGLESNQDISRGDPSAVGFSGGEPVAKGLVGRHAYSLLDYGYGPDKSKKPDSGNQRWVFVQNPWQQYGRQYNSRGKASDNSSFMNRKGNGGFWLELADLTKRYHSVGIGNISAND